RLLAGRWRDPMVGRDVLFGVLLGVVYVMLFFGFQLTEMYRGDPPAPFFASQNWNGTRWFGFMMAAHVDYAAWGALYFFMFLLLLGVILRKQWLAGAAFVVFLAGTHGPTWTSPAA